MTLAQQPLPVIRRARADDQHHLTMLLVAAFFHGDLAPYLVPDIADRASRYWPYFEIFAEHALGCADVDLIMEDEAAMPAAAAIWHRVGQQGLRFDLPDYDIRLVNAVGKWLPRFLALDEAMHRHHPAGREHDYLAYLAVQPALQNKGLGSRLLDHRHKHPDTAGRPAYLEATGDRNRRLYERHGYTLLTPYQVGPRGPLLYPMWLPGLRD
ncbi:N-acetyltransferase [Paractinoplanes deccanensis]|uniref:N-acetyltransferase n=1 Tax=Paractinoplanes deccanensis TaxID=113561 RepID=A0ABQ3Y173_9ACTN|nr:GNAT family N-acetyltransferase [Actinoplanes deccanensis]GID73717.1 N-acetyltransferase [Actinoplanes deccanensis]